MTLKELYETFWCEFPFFNYDFTLFFVGYLTSKCCSWKMKLTCWYNPCPLRIHIKSTEGIITELPICNNQKANIPGCFPNMLSPLPLTVHCYIKWMTRFWVQAHTMLKDQFGFKISILTKPKKEFLMSTFGTWLWTALSVYHRDIESLVPRNFS